MSPSAYKKTQHDVQPLSQTALPQEKPELERAGPLDLGTVNLSVRELEQDSRLVLAEEN